MKLLGRGWQYTAYDIGNGKVLKKYNTWLDAYLIMLKDSVLHLRFPVVHFMHYYREGKKDAARSLREVSESSLDKAMFGNPKIGPDYEYEQTFAESLSKYLKRLSVEEGRRMIDMFIEFNTVLLQNSLIEKNFNIGDNFGIDKAGTIILIDLGELCTTQEEIRAQLQKRVWAVPDVLSRLPSNLRSYFVEKMDQAFAQGGVAQ